MYRCANKYDITNDHKILKHTQFANLSNVRYDSIYYSVKFLSLVAGNVNVADFIAITLRCHVSFETNMPLYSPRIPHYCIRCLPIAFGWLPHIRSSLNFRLSLREQSKILFKVLCYLSGAVTVISLMLANELLK